MNVNSNAYTYTFATVMVVVVAVLLAGASLGLKSKQENNVKQEKMQSILASVGVKVDRSEAQAAYDEVIKEVLTIQQARRARCIPDGARQGPVTAQRGEGDEGLQDGGYRAAQQGAPRDVEVQRHRRLPPRWLSTGETC